MNSPRIPDPWSRLTAAARPLPDARETAAPYGFATRVAALALSQEWKVVSLFERFAFRAVGVSCLLALTSVIVNYSAVTSSPAVVAIEEYSLPTDDAIAVLVDFGD